MSDSLRLQVRTELYKRKLTMRFLADELNISQAYLSDIINGNRHGDKAQEHIKKIKYILEIK